MLCGPLNSDDIVRGCDSTSMAQSKFPQFPAAGLTFLRKLKRNNHREWFLENKQTYEEYVRQPMIELVNALAPEFATFAPEIVATPKVSLYRICLLYTSPSPRD